MQTVLVTFGTRPEAIKMVPVVRALRERAADFRCLVCVTAQHRDMLDQVLERFELTPDIDLDLMRPGQTPAQVTSRVLESFTAVMADTKADRVLVQGDTTTAMAAALAAFLAHVPVAHVEAGLRSGRMDAPFPEEMNRVVIDRFADALYPPTRGAAAHLAAEGIPAERMLVTGNTAIDALLWMRGRLTDLDLPIRETLGGVERMVLITAHRRESFGAPLREVFQGLEELAGSRPDVTFVYPVHPNPAVLGPAQAHLRAPNIRLVDPVDYSELVWLMDNCEIVISDSGGLQEEASTLGKPVLVLRDVTERPELIEAGAGLLVGTDRARLVRAAGHLLDDADARARMGTPRTLFGDGQAGPRIAAHLAGAEVQPWAPAPIAGASA